MSLRSMRFLLSRIRISSGRHFGTTTLVLLLLALGACGQLSRPFQPADKVERAQEAIGNAAVLLVLPLEEGAPGREGIAARSLAQALRDRGIDAATDATVAEYQVSGRALVERRPTGQDLVTITWELRQTEGEALGLFEQQSELPADLWRVGQTAAVASVMAEASRGLAAMLRQAQETAAGSTLEEGPKPRLVILPMESLPGDGAQSLSAALRAELEAAEYQVDQEIEDPDLLIMGEVGLTPAGAGWQNIAITWWVVRASDGSDIGTIDQSNRIREGALEGAWGLTAYAIARGAADGILEVLARGRGS